MGKNKDTQPRSRRKQTANGKAVKKAAEEAAKRAAERAQNAQAVNNMFRAGSQSGRAADEAGAPEPAEVDAAQDEAAESGTLPQAATAAPAAPAAPAAAPDPQREEVRPDDVRVTEEEEHLNPRAESVMREYARGILVRLRTELHHSASANDNSWLLDKLRANGWWLRAEHARSVMEKLPANSNSKTWPDAFYMKDIYFWAPDVRWPDVVVTCPRCKSRRTAPHDYQMHSPTRQCTDLTTTVHLMGRRHICHACKEEYEQARAPAQCSTSRRLSNHKPPTPPQSHRHYPQRHNHTATITPPQSHRHNHTAPCPAPPTRRALPLLVQARF